MIRTGVFALVLSACGPDVAQTPHVSLQQLSRAVEAGDTAKTLAYIDIDAIAARMIRDVVKAVRDSLGNPGDTAISPEFRARFDSVKATWVAWIRTDLGLSRSESAGREAASADSDAEDEPAEVYPDEDVLAEGAEVVGDGAVRYVGDTALVARMLRYAYLDTSATLTLALVPVDRAHWRIVAFHNAVPLAKALRRRQDAILERANRSLRDSIAARVAIRDVVVTREPLDEWDRWAVVVHATVQNPSSAPVVLHSAQLVGPHLSLDDSVGQLLARPLTVAPASASPIVWRRPLRGEHLGPYHLVENPRRYKIEIADVQFGGTRPARVRLYRTWESFVEQNPLPARSTGGVLAHVRPSRAPESVALGSGEGM